MDESANKNANRLTTNAQFTMEQITKESLEYIPNNTTILINTATLLKSFRLSQIYSAFVKTLIICNYNIFIIPEAMTGTTDAIFQHVRGMIYEDGGRGNIDMELNGYLSIMAERMDKNSENKSFKGEFRNVMDIDIDAARDAYTMYIKACAEKKNNYFSGYLFSILVSFYLFLGNTRSDNERCSVLFYGKNEIPVFKRITEGLGFHFLSESINDNYYSKIINQLEIIYTHYKQDNSGIQNNKGIIIKNTVFSLYSDVVYVLATITRLADLYFIVNDKEMDVIMPPTACIQPHEFTFSIFYAILCFIYNHYLSEKGDCVLSFDKKFDINFEEFNKTDEGSSNKDKEFNEPNVLMIPIITFLLQLLSYNFKAIAFTKQSYEDVGLAFRINEKEEIQKSSTDKETPEIRHKNITVFLNCFLNLLEKFYIRFIGCDENNQIFHTIITSIKYSYCTLIRCSFYNNLYDEVIKRLDNCKDETISEWIVNSIETCHPDLFLYKINYNPNEGKDTLHESIYSVTEDSRDLHMKCFENLKVNLERMQNNIRQKFKDRNLGINRTKYIELYNTMQTWFLKIQGQYYDCNPKTIPKIEMLGIFQPIGQNMLTHIFNYPIYPNTGIHTFVYRFNQEDPLDVIYGLSEYTVPSSFIGFNYTSVGYHGLGFFYCKGKKIDGFMKLGKKFEPRIENRMPMKRYNPEEIFLTYDSCRGYLEVAFVAVKDSNYLDLFIPVAYFKVDNSHVYYPSVSCNSKADFTLIHYNNVIEEIFKDYKVEDYNCRKSGHFSKGDCLYDNRCYEQGKEYIERMCDFISREIKPTKEVEDDEEEDDDDEDSNNQIKLGLFRVFDNFISQLCLYSYFPDFDNYYNLLDERLLPLANQFDSIILPDLNEIDSEYDYTLTGHYTFLYQKIYPLPEEKTKFFNIDLEQDEIYVKGIQQIRENEGKKEIYGRADGNTWEFTLTTELSKTERQIFTCHSVIMPSGNRFIGKFENPRNNSYGYFIGIKTSELENLKVNEIELLKVKTSTKLHYLIGKATASYSCINRMTNVIDYEYVINKCPNIFNSKFLLFYVTDREKDKSVLDMCENIFKEKDDYYKDMYESLFKEKYEEKNEYPVDNISKVIENRMLDIIDNILKFIESDDNKDVFLKYKINTNGNEWKLYRIAIGLFYYHLTGCKVINDENIEEFSKNNILHSINERNEVFIGDGYDLLYFKDQLIKHFNSVFNESITKRSNTIEGQNKKKIEDVNEISVDEKHNIEVRIFDCLYEKVEELFYLYPLIHSLPEKYNRRTIIDEFITFLFQPSFVDKENNDHFLEFMRYKVSGILHYCYSFHRFEKLLIGNSHIKYAGNMYMYLYWYKRFQNYTYFIPVNHVDDPTYLHYIIQDVSEENFFLSLIGKMENKKFQFNPDEIQSTIEKEMLLKLVPDIECTINESYSKIFKQLIDYLPNDYDNNKSLSSVDISKYLAIIDSFYKRYTPNELKCIKENYINELKEKIQYIFNIDDGILKKSYSFFLFTLSKSICINDKDSKESVGISIIEKILTELHNPINSHLNTSVNVRDTFNEIITLDIYQDIYSPSISILTELSNTRIVDTKIYLPILIRVFLACNHSELPFIIVKFLNNWLPDISNPQELKIVIPEEILKYYFDKGDNEQISSSNQIIQLFLTMSGFIYPVHFGCFIKYFLKTDTYILACRVTSLLRNLQKKSVSWSNIINDEINRVLTEVKTINEENVKAENFGDSKKSLKDIFNQKDTLFYKFIGCLHVMGGNYEVLTIGSRVEVLQDVIELPSYSGTVLSMYKEYFSKISGELIQDPYLESDNGVPKESTTYQVKEYCDIKCDNGKIKEKVNTDLITPIPLINTQPYRISEDIIERVIDMVDMIYTYYYDYSIVKANTDFFFIVTFMIFSTNSLSNLVHNKRTIQIMVNKKPDMLVKAIRLSSCVLSSTSSLYDHPTYHEAFKELFHFWNEKEMSYISRNIEPEIYQSYRQLNSNQIDALKSLVDLQLPVEKAMKFIEGEEHPNNEDIVMRLYEEEYSDRKENTKRFSYLGVVSGDGTVNGNNVIASNEKFLTFTVGIPSATCVTGGKYYYEVLINEIGDGVYFGWADPAYSKVNIDEKYALGADRHSYSWGGREGVKSFISRNAISLETEHILNNGFIIGCLLDLESIPNSISYFINGNSYFIAFQFTTNYEYLYPIIALKSTIDKKANVIIRMNNKNPPQFIPKGYTPIMEDREEFVRELFIKPNEKELEEYNTLNNANSITRDSFNQTIYSNSTINRFYRCSNKKTDSVLTMDTINNIINKPNHRSSARYDYQLNLKTFTQIDTDLSVRKNVTTTLYKLEIKCFVLTLRVFILELMKYWIVCKPIDEKGNLYQCLEYFSYYDLSKNKDKEKDVIDKERDSLYSSIATFIKICTNYPLDYFTPLPIDAENDPNEILDIPPVCSKYEDIYSKSHSSYYKLIYNVNENKKKNTHLLYSKVIQALITYDLSIKHDMTNEISKLLLRLIRTESILSSEFENKDNSLVLENRYPFEIREDHISYNESYAVKQCSMQLIEILTDELLNYYSDDFDFVYVIFRSWIITLQSPYAPLKSYGAAVLSSILNHISYLYQNGSIKREKDKWKRIVEDIPHLRLKAFMNKEIYRSFSNYPMHSEDVQNLYSLIASMNNAERLLSVNNEIIHNSSWKDGFDLGVVSDEFLVQLSGFSGDSGSDGSNDYKEIEQGDYVIRGPDWKPYYYNQDGGEGSVGVVNSILPKSSSSKEKYYEVEVEWMNSAGLPMSYFWNKDGEHDIQIVEYDRLNKKILKKLPVVGERKKKIVRTGVRLTIHNNLRNENECEFDGVIEYPQYCGKIKIEGLLGKIERKEDRIERTIKFSETSFLAGNSSSGWEWRYGYSHWIPIKDYNGILKIFNNRITAHIQYTIQTTKTVDSKIETIETVCESILSSDHLFQFMKEMSSTKQVRINDDNDTISYNSDKNAYIYGSCGFVHGVKYFELKISNSSDNTRIGIGITSEIPVVDKPIDMPYPQFIYYSNSQLQIMREKETENNNPQQLENNDQPRGNRNRIIPYGGLYNKGDVVGVNVNSSSDTLSFIYDGEKYKIPQLHEFPDATKDITVGNSYPSEWTIYPLIIFSQKFNDTYPEVKVHKWLSVEEYPSDTLLFYGEVFDYLTYSFINDEKQVKIPKEALPYAYSYCKRWLSNKYRRYETRVKGIYVDLNIDEKEFIELQSNRRSENILKAGTIGKMNNKEIEILGCYRGKIWYRLSTADQLDGYSRITRSVWYLNEDEWDSIEIKDVIKNNYNDSTPFKVNGKEISYEVFEEALNNVNNTKEYYLEVVKMINRICENKGVIPSNVIYRYVEEYLRNNHKNSNNNDNKILRCFSVISVLMMLNMIIEKVLSYTKMDQTLSFNDTTFGNSNNDKRKWTSFSQTNYIHQMKKYLFTLTKRNYLDRIVVATETVIYYQVDDLTESRLINTIKINRFTNVEGVQPIFHQIVDYFKDDRYSINDQTFRINYQGAKQGGQYRMFRVKLIDEGVVDSGGAYRAVFEQMIDDLKKESVELPNTFDIKNKLPLLIKYNDKYLINFFNDSVSFYQEIYYFGILIASAYRCKMELNIPFIPMIWKCLVGKNIDEDEMKEIVDRYIYFMNEHDNEDNESNIDIEKEARIRKDVYKRIKCTINQFCKGFYICIPQESLSILNEEELEKMICGVGKLNLYDLRNHTIYDNYIEKDIVIKDFWYVLSEFNDEELNKFMNFAWAKTRLSSNGIDFDFLIRKREVGVDDNPDDYLPTSHTCFYSLDLPAYSSREIMKKKLEYAMNEASTLDADFVEDFALIYAQMD